MDREWITGLFISLFVGVVLVLCAPFAEAGPPLICWPFDIGGARSLPWGGSQWHDARSDYDSSRLAADTLALLGPDVPVLVRMETMRRAAIYAETNPQAAQALFSQLEERTKAAGKTDPLRLFDLGYFTESYRQASLAAHSARQVGVKRDGKEFVERALALQGADAQMEFAAALVASSAGLRDAAFQHLEKAAAGAADGSLLEKNLVTHCHLLGIRAETLAGLRSQLAAKRE